MGSVRANVTIAVAIGGVVASVSVALIALTRANPSSAAIWLGVVVGIAVAALMGWFASASLAREFEQVRVVAQDAAEGNFIRKGEPTGTREIAELGRAVNRLVGEFESAQQRSAQERRWVEAIFDGLQDGIMLVNSQEQVIAANSRAGELLGLAGDVQIGQRLMVLARDYELVDQFRTVMRSGERQLRTVYLSLSERFIDIAVMPVETEGERFGLVVLRDVTDLSL